MAACVFFHACAPASTRCVFFHAPGTGRMKPACRLSLVSAETGGNVFQAGKRNKYKASAPHGTPDLGLFALLLSRCTRSTADLNHMEVDGK